MTSHEVLFNVDSTSPESFDIEWEEGNRSVNGSMPVEESVDIDFFDFCKQHAEAEQVDKDTPNSVADEFEKFWSRFDFPYEGDE